MDKDQLVSRIFLRSALPLTKVVGEEIPKFKKLWPKNAVLQFSVKNSDVGAALVWEDRELSVYQGIHPAPCLNLIFSSLDGLNGFFAGKMGLPYMPRPKGLFSLHLLFRALPLLLTLKLLMPDAQPKDPDKRALKVKLVIYMITNALSQLNKAGEPNMKKLTDKSPDRIYQWTVEGGGPTAYLRMKNGKTKAGRGTYTRRRPFVHMIFPNIDGAFMVLTNQAPLVEAVKQGFVKTEGAMEYSKEIGLMMQRVEEMTS